MKNSNGIVSRLKTLQEQRDAIDRQMSELKNDSESITNICDQVKAMAKEAGVPVREIAFALVPALSKADSNVELPKVGKKPRSVKVYLNPHNGERIETKGGNHKLLKEWKLKHGSNEVETWVQR
jgi:hypothetical protein